MCFSWKLRIRNQSIWANRNKWRHHTSFRAKKFGIVLVPNMSSYLSVVVFGCPSTDGNWRLSTQKRSLKSLRWAFPRPPRSSWVANEDAPVREFCLSVTEKAKKNVHNFWDSHHFYCDIISVCCRTKRCKRGYAAVVFIPWSYYMLWLHW